MEKQYFIYLTTNLINDKKYIGYHYGLPNDNYLGSGRNILKAIKKYGSQNFKREILEFCPGGLSDALQKEKKWIQYFNAVNDENFYNISEGGENDTGWKQAHKWFKEHPKKAQELYKKNYQNLKHWQENHPEEVKRNIEKMIEGSKRWRKNNPNLVEQQMKKVNKAKEQWQKEHPIEHQKQIDEWRQAGSIANSKKIICITTGKIFNSISEAAREYAQYGCSQGNISKVLKGERKSCGKINNQKLEWKFLNDF